MKDELVFLGTGGGRHHIKTQYRATGGILYKFNGIQCHIDPGPGAIVRINQYKEDPVKTELIIVTHVHIDHSNDINVIIEAARDRFYDDNKKWVKKGTLICPKDVLGIISKYHLNMLYKVVNFKAGDNFNYKGVEIIGTKVIHGNVEGFGIKIIKKDYTIAFSSDTMVFDGLSEQYSDVNILVLNLLRPDSVKCNRHLCTDEVIPYLNKIKPPLDALIITHFGTFMNGPGSNINYVPSQVEKLKEKTSIKKIVSTEDGLKIRIDELFD